MGCLRSTPHSQTASSLTFTLSDTLHALLVTEHSDASCRLPVGEGSKDRGDSGEDISNFGECLGAEVSKDLPIWCTYAYRAWHFCWSCMCLHQSASF